MLRRQQKSYTNKTLLKSLWNNTAKTSPSGIYLYKSLKRGIYQTCSSLLVIIKPTPDFQFVNIQQGCKLNKGCSITKENVSIIK